MPVSPNQVKKLIVTTEDIEKALQKALTERFLDNLRARPIAVQLDCKIRGYIGELALKRWFSALGIEFESSNTMVDGEQIDIDFLYQAANKKINIEVKTSLLPDKYATIGDAMQHCDIKLIRRGAQQIADIKGDVHIQIYYNFYRQKRDKWLETLILDLKDNALIYKQLRLEKYAEATYFVAWIDKPSLVADLEKRPLEQQKWSFKGSQREFWKCNLAKQSKPADGIVDYLRSM